jgi:hypothetical protein
LIAKSENQANVEETNIVVKNNVAGIADRKILDFFIKVLLESSTSILNLFFKIHSV